LKRWALAALVLVEGAALGWAVASGLGVERAEAPPDGWRVAERPAPYMNPATLGTLGVTPTEWMIGRFGALGRDLGAETLALTVRLGDGGALTILPAGGSVEQPVGEAILLEDGQPPTGLLLRSKGTPSALRCSGSAPPLGAGPTPVSIRRTAAALEVDVNGSTLRCSAKPPKGGLVLQSGLRRVHVGPIALDGAAVAPPATVGGQVLGALLGAVALGLLVLLQVGLLGGSPGLAALGWLPLLLCLPLSGWDSAPLREVLRVPDLPLRRIPVLVGLVPAVSLQLLGGAVRLAGGAPEATRVAWGLAVLLSIGAAAAVGWPAGLGVLAGLLVVPPLAARLLGRESSVSAPHAAASVALVAAAASFAVVAAENDTLRLYFTFSGAALGGLAWAAAQASRQRLRLYNVLSLALALGALGALETAVRFSPVGPFWQGAGGVQAAGTAGTLVAQFEALEAGAFTTWPSAGYPVQAPPRRDALRIVALGGSSTAGAYQNSSMDEFYPSKLNTILGPSVDVVNQGVGGWNSFHLARFAEKGLGRLEPDVITVYCGVNELVEVPVPYRDLHTAWRDGALRAGPSWLEDLRLFHGLRFLARAVRGSTVAVPPDHTQENLNAIAMAAEGMNARVLLMSEAVNPRPDALKPWWDAMRAVADAHPHVSFLHSAPLFTPRASSSFLDQNHLSDPGHRDLARALANELKRLGWLEATGSAPPATGQTTVPESPR
jgi:lysophospholipase L1-like esterase